MSTLVPPQLQWVRRWYAKRSPDDGSIAARRLAGPLTVTGRPLIVGGGLTCPAAGDRQGR